MLNWWDIIEIPGYCSLNTKMRLVIQGAGMEKTQELMGFVMGAAAQPKMLNMLDSMTVLRLINLITGAMHMEITKEQLMDLNAQLNKIAMP